MSKTNSNRSSPARKRPTAKANIKNTVAAILLKNGRFLVEKRSSDDDHDPGFIAIPGGHVEKGESFNGALKREMKEELGVQLLETKRLHIGLHTTTSGERNRIHYFRVTRWKGRIVSHEAEKVYWETDASSLTAPVDRKAVKQVL
ncbi:MAG TPA: NUDIX domain-containing protein [Candidatus Binatus sp.]|nr:NUDIX domain-containing protein [Candidatus Binatus sp.]